MSDVSGSTPMWRPWALRTKPLIGFIFLCLFLVIGGVIVLFGCAPHGCRIFGASSYGNIPIQSDFVYRQLPTMLSVGISLLWIVPHHHIIRLEPYFRMSAKDGEKATASLYLEYPYDIALFLPFKALFKRHYVVSLSSIILFLMNFLIVPLLPSIFDMSVVIGGVARGSFDISNHSVSAESTFPAYEYTWRNGSLLPFMTDTYALMPLRRVGGVSLGENWTIEAALFEAELQCTDAQPPAIGYVNNSLTVNITSLDGGYEVHLCDAGALEQGRIKLDPFCDDYTAFITPWTSISWQLGNTEERPMSYMYAWASGPSSSPDITTNYTFPMPTNITAVFCTPLYYSETVEAIIRMPSGKVLKIHRSGERKEISSLRGFNGILDGQFETNFTNEKLVQGVTSMYQVPVRFGYPPETIMSAGSDLIKRFGASRRPIRSMYLWHASQSTVFMTQTNSLSTLSLSEKTNGTVGGLLNSRELESMHDRGLEMLFAFAVAMEVVGVPTLSITVNQNWALAAAIGLGLIMALTVSLVVLIQRRPCKLNGEPDSLAASLRLLSASPGLCATMRWAEYHKPEVLSEAMDAANLFFKLDYMDRKGQVIHVMRGTGDNAIEVLNAELLLDPGHNRVVQVETRWTHLTIIRAVCLACFPIVVVLLIVNLTESRENGFPMPGGPNSFRSKILYTHFPTALGNIIEPILISLGATYCMVGPYRALGTGTASYSSSLAVDYDRLPPHFQLRTSFRNRDYTLVALSVGILLSNVLPIALVGLYTRSLYAPKIPKPHKVLQNFTSMRMDMYRQLHTTLTSDYPPAWTTKELYIDPPYEVTPSGEGTYDTLGFGMNISCTPLADNRITFPCSPQYGGGITASTCANLMTTIGPRDNFLYIENPCGTSDQTFLYWNGTCADSILGGRRSCINRIFPVWAENEKFALNGTGDSYRFVGLNCSFADRIVELRTTMKDGQVSSVTNMRPLDTQQIALLYPKDISSFISLSNNFIDLLRNDAEDILGLGQHPIARISNLMASVNASVVREPVSVKKRSFFI